MKTSIITIALLSSIVNAAFSQSTEKVKNIILMIGDGMGNAQVSAAYTINQGILNLERSQYIGLFRTSSADEYVTDSGAGGTALATGQKTNNKFIAMTPDSISLKTILELAEENGLSTGMVVTCEMTHATPASFIAHQPSRYDTLNIAADYVGSGIDIFIGGGRRHFEERTDSLNISDLLREEGYSIVYDLESVKEDSATNIGCFIADNHPLSVMEGRGDYLTEATRIALDKLKTNAQGFFIMVEGSQIDWGGHSNNFSFQISETIDFDKAVGEAMNFADEHPGTLVVVTADHETGGLALVDGDISNGQVEAKYSSDNHTAVMVPVFAYGTGAEIFSGIYENTELFHKMLRLYDFK
ncbi:MAG: alkaline phosphatase [Bacteroidales bacterium]|nr:alkaline phosphatase [Bacteroidales bacterium]